MDCQPRRILKATLSNDLYWESQRGSALNFFRNFRFSGPSRNELEKSTAHIIAYQF